MYCCARLSKFLFYACPKNKKAKERVCAFLLPFRRAEHWTSFGREARRAPRHRRGETAGRLRRSRLTAPSGLLLIFLWRAKTTSRSDGGTQRGPQGEDPLGRIRIKSKAPRRAKQTLEPAQPTLSSSSPLAVPGHPSLLGTVPVTLSADAWRTSPPSPFGAGDGRRKRQRTRTYRTTYP